MSKAIVLCSGGLDSTTCLVWALKQGYDVEALSFQYGQKHQAELDACQRIMTAFQVKHHHIFPIPLNHFGHSALTDTALAVPDYIGDGEIPLTYVPARNTIFLSIALALAEVRQASRIVIGVSSVDYSGYPDCRPEYIEAFTHMANLATKDGVSGKHITIDTPLIHLSKAETIALGIRMGIDYAITVSCYRASAQGEACGRCDSCVIREQGFQEAGFPDPTIYVTTHQNQE